MHLRNPSCRRIAYEPVLSPAIFSFIAAIVRSAGRSIDAALNRRHHRDVIFAAGPPLICHEKSLTNNTIDQSTAPYFATAASLVAASPEMPSANSGEKTTWRQVLAAIIPPGLVLSSSVKGGSLSRSGFGGF
jgi:hypothetical protein